MTTTFRAARWLPGPHAQTMWAQLARPRALVDPRREAIATGDGDELILDHLDGPEGAPRLLLLHGLEGSSFSAYAQSMLAAARRRGWRATALNFRSCARRLDDRMTWIPNRRPRLYHSGETTDFDLLVRGLTEADGQGPLFAFGVSLGGNVLLKWLGEHPDQRAVVAAVAVSVPYDLGEGARHLRRPLGRLYYRHFHRTLTAKLAHLTACFPEAPVDLEGARRARDFVAYDQAATAPLHGFDGADDYYRRASSISFLEAITTPTLCINSVDDPFLPARVLDEVRRRASSALSLDFPPEGGHVGFLEGPSPRRVTAWAEGRAFEWFESHLEV